MAQNEANRTCVDCDPTCAECDASLQCLKCLTSGYYTILNYNSSTGTANCLSACPKGYLKDYSRNLCYSTCPNGYANNTTSSECRKCADNCAVCTISGTTLQCSQCNSGFYLINNTKCLSTCPAFGQQGSTWTCVDGTDAI